MAINFDDTPFNLDQFLADYLNADIFDEETWDSFTQILNSNIDHFASYTKPDISNYFGQFAPEYRNSIYTTLAETVLVHLDLKNKYKSKDNIKDSCISEDIYDFFQLLSADNSKIRSYGFSKNFSKIHNKKKNLSNLLEQNINLLTN